jgi:hypothetical protein
MRLVRLVWSTLQGRLSESLSSPQARNKLYRKSYIRHELVADGEQKPTERVALHLWPDQVIIHEDGLYFRL